MSEITKELYALIELVNSKEVGWTEINKKRDEILAMFDTPQPEGETVCECPKDSGRHLGNFDGTILCNVCNLPKTDTPAPAEKVKLTEIELLELAEVDVEAFHQWKKEGKLPAGWKRTKYKDTPSPARG